MTGGYVYRGPIASLQGKYFFGDFVNSRIWSIEYDGSEVSEFIDWTSLLTPDAGTINSIASFGEDGAGNLYIVDFGGEIFRIQQATRAITVAASDITSGVNFGQQSTALGSISGTVWIDADADGIFDAGELTQSGVTIFLDTDGDGILDAGEQSQVTGANGVYTFTGLSAGTYTVAQIVPEGYSQTAPALQVQAVVNEVSQNAYTSFHLDVEKMGLGLYGGAAYNQGFRNRDGWAGPGSLGNQEAR